MHTISADTEPKVRTLRLRVALAVGGAVIAGALGAGYILSAAPDGSVGATATEPGLRAAAGHTFGAALTDSLALKQRSTARHRASDIRFRRIE